MNWLKYKVLAVGGVIALVCVAAATFGLIHFKGKYGKAASELKSVSDRLDQLNRRNPFPAASNVTIVQQNREKLNDFVASLRNDFRSGQVEAETMEPAQFASFLEGIRRDVRSRAVAAQVKLPEPMSLGFARYVAGALPQTADIPRLVVQAREVAALCGVIFDARIDTLIDMQRTHFEGAPDAAGGLLPAGMAGSEGSLAATLLTRLALPAIESNELYSAERFGIVFQGREGAAWEVLNGLARSGIFAVVRHIELVSEVDAKKKSAGSALAPPMPGAGGAKAAALIPAPREERVVAGREPVQVSLVVDVYRFIGPAPAEGAP